MLESFEVLEHRIGGPPVPLGDPPAGDVRLEQADAALVAVEVPRPADADVVVERARVVLRQDDDVVMSELTQFESVKSMIRYLPPNGTAGLARFYDRIESRSPSPPARITAIVFFTPGPPIWDAVVWVHRC